jgi:hypothetical protein
VSRYTCPLATLLPVTALLAVTALLGASPVQAESGTVGSVTDSTTDIDREIKTATTMVLAQTESYDQVATVLQEARGRLEPGSRPAATGALSSAPLRSYYRARVAYVAGLNAALHGRDREADRRLRDAVEHAERASTANGLERRRRSDSYRIIADAHAQLLRLNGVMHMLAHGGSARDAAFAALEADPANPHAHATVAAYYAHTPGPVGGDPEKAVEHAERVFSLTAREDRIPRFLALLWQARAEHKQDMTRQAARSVAAALELFPRNEWARELKREINGS